MPKIKTKSGAKKRFKVTGSGKVLYAQSRKRHGMIKRTKKQIRQLRRHQRAVQDRRRQHQKILFAERLTPARDLPAGGGKRSGWGEPFQRSANSQRRSTMARVKTRASHPMPSTNRSAAVGRSSATLDGTLMSDYASTSNLKAVGKVLAILVAATVVAFLAAWFLAQAICLCSLKLHSDLADLTLRTQRRVSIHTFASAVVADLCAHATSRGFRAAIGEIEGRTV